MSQQQQQQQQQQQTKHETHILATLLWPFWFFLICNQGFQMIFRDTLR